MKLNAGQSTGEFRHGNERQLGVHVLTEFVYCHRAGIVAWAKGGPDQGDEIQREPWASLSYAPFYDFAAIQSAIRKHRSQAIIAGIFMMVCVLASIFTYFRPGLAWLGLAFVGYLMAIWTAMCLLEMAQSMWLAWHAVHDRGSEPDPNCQADQLVDWWAMFRADFDRVPYQEGQSLKCDGLNLAGRPWRVLRRGSILIPVFKKRHSASENGKKLHDQHYIRIAAYCHLLETSEGGKSPYGIILFNDTYTGIAINAGAARAKHGLVTVLAEVRDIIDSWHAGKFPQPRAADVCRKCPIGHPRVHRPGETDTLSENVALPVYGAVGRDGRTYHSPCGDHFRWLPPHERVVEKGLTEPSAKPAS